METFAEGLSFDDVLLVPQLSEILPSEVSLETQFLPNIKLNIPVVSSAMDTVTEDKLATALAREGGIGVIHRNNTIEEQATMVRKVKRSENSVIYDPYTVSPDITVEEMDALKTSLGVSGLPVVESDGQLIGIITGRDTRHLDNRSVKVREVMTPKDRLITAPENTSPEEARKILYQNRIEKLPLVDGAGRLTGLITGADIENRLTFTNAAKDESGHLVCGAAVGVGPEYLERAKALEEAGADAIFLDAATGHTSRVLQVISDLRSHTNLPVVAGNVVTSYGAKDLIDAGANAIKVGVGPGSICTTRVVAGVGMPQFTAIRNAAEYAQDKGVTVIADGGIRYSGDVVKALAGGAGAVMLGSLLAGTAESPGQMVNYQGRRFKSYRGMGSLGAMNKGKGAAKDRYAQNASGKMVAEGVEGRVPYKGALADVVFQLMGGLRSGMGYVGASNLDELQKRAKFTKITSGGLRESHAHDIMITEEPTNYQPLS